MLITRKCHGI